jgi:hypothetical protein
MPVLQPSGPMSPKRTCWPVRSYAELTNYLVAAYCPVVNRNSALSVKEKRAAVKRFADQVREQLR